ncbi:MAG: D-aminoacyl-tRNA deacylase [Candidatus Ancaeobacter aquaticus]|nr:D-aminoacyl-tRNA deacylase [Candidatus Ancaeobacter aquaticus]
MRALIQRVNKAAVTVAKKEIAAIDSGLLIFLGVSKTDTEADIEWLVKKIPHMRIFDDADGKMNISCVDARAQILVVSQFTLYADCSKGRRPGFDSSAEPEKARKYYELFIERIKEYCQTILSGEFAASMVVSLENNGPVTIMLDSNDR